MMTEPSDLSAAKAKPVEKIWTTFVPSKVATAELLPPWLESPQVMTEPSDLSAAKAELVENTWTTFFKLAATARLLPP